MRGGTLQRFSSYMTGELFEVSPQHACLTNANVPANLGGFQI